MKLRKHRKIKKQKELHSIQCIIKENSDSVSTEAAKLVSSTVRSLTCSFKLLSSSFVIIYIEMI